jgi:hypothetical protein
LYKTKAHPLKLKAYRTRAAEDSVVKVSLTDYYKAHPDEKLSSLPLETQFFRLRVVETLMFAGIDISKADDLRPLLERNNGPSIGSSPHLRLLIPKVHDFELERLRDELTGEALGIAVDGTRRVAEAVCVTARLCSMDFKIVLRLVQFITLEKHLDGISTAKLLTHLLLRKLNLSIDQIVSWSRDSVASNGVAMARLCSTFSDSVDLKCLPHTLNHVGEHFDWIVLDDFLGAWVTLVCNNERAKSLWGASIDGPPSGYSNIRWHSKAEIGQQIARNFSQLGPFLGKLVELGIGEATTSRMRRIFTEQCTQLQIELAALLDARLLVATTYELEGDRLEILLAHSRIETLRSFGRTLGQPGVLRNVEAVLRSSIPLVPNVVVTCTHTPLAIFNSDPYLTTETFCTPRTCPRA